MASRFVSGGTIAGDSGSTSAGDSSSSNGSDSRSVPQQPPTSIGASSASTGATRDREREWDKEAAKRNAEWEAVQRDLEADRRRREEARRAQVEGGAGAGEARSLYDVLQANKAAKQAAFEEKARLSNQFRALDDDEIDFLEGVRDERRIEEERVKRETEERLASFRQAQKATGTAADDGDGDVAREDNGDGGSVGGIGEWTGVGKKRKRSDKETKSIVKGVKKRPSGSEKEGHGPAGEKTSDTGPEVQKAKTESEPDSKPEANVTTNTDARSSAAKDRAKPVEETKAQEDPKPKPKFGLVDYGSDEDDDD
ncbi:N-terminal domain of NEFA-interacting nuclear protein NIP30-domain-containing protein [Daldinia bambusicola]|nr:N-terminal domain of NEFA-interacting nuclear protein NIP30-domain-containing protein [Daldinia bambusicola]